MSRSKAMRKGVKRKKRRWGRRILVAFLLGVTAICAALLISPALFIEWTATRILTAQGLAPASMRVERAGWRVFIVRDFALGSGPDLSIGTLRLDYVLSELVRGRVRKISLDDVHVRARALSDQSTSGEERILSFGVLDQLVSHIILGVRPDQQTPLELTLSNGLFKVETPVGAVSMAFGVSWTPHSGADAFVQLQQQERDEKTAELDVDRLEATWRQSADGVQNARFDLSLGRLALEGIEIENAQIAFAYEGEGTDGGGAVDLHMPVIAISKERSRAFQDLLSDDVRDALAAPLAAAFADKLGMAFGDMLESSALKGRLLIKRNEQGVALTFDEPLVFAGMPSTNGNRPLPLRVSVGNADDRQPFLAFHISENPRLNFFSRMLVAGGGLPELNVRFLGSVAVLALSSSGATPSLTSSSSLGANPVLARVLIDLAPWSEGGFTIGAKGLDLSIEGRPGLFSGRMVGEIFLDGSPVEGVSVVDGALGLAGSFERGQRGLFYTQATDSCMVLKSENIQITGIKFNRPILSMCADEGEPLLHVLFGEGRQTEIQLNVTIPSEQTRVILDTGLDVSGQFPQVNLYTEYITSTQQWRLTYGLYDGLLALNSGAALIKDLKLSGIASGMAERLEEATAALDQAIVSDGEEFPLFAPVRLVGQLELNEDRSVYSAFATDQGGRTMAEFEGDFDRRIGEGRLAGQTPLLLFAPAGFQPQDWLPALKGVIAEVQGTASAQMSVQWTADHLESSARVILTELKMATSIGPMTGVNGNIAFSSLLPPITKKPQIIRIREIDVGTDLLFGVLSFSVSPEGKIYLENAEWPWAGGVIGVARTELYFDEREQELVLTAKDINIAEVFTLLDVDGLEGTGILGGQLPVSITQGSIEITDGQLVSSPEGGTLQYRGSASQAASTEEGSSLLFNALQDFRYDELKVSINGRTTDILTVSIALNGYNPTVLNGYPIKLNINTEGPLVEMIKQGTIGYRVPSQIRQRLNQDTR